MRIVLALIVSVFLAAAGIAQQNPSSQDTAAESARQAAAKEKKGKKETAAPSPAAPDKTTESKTAEQPKPDSAEVPDKDEHYDVSEVPPVITHHSITVNGKSLSYTATAGRLPLKRGDGKIEAEMFFVAYTLDGQTASQRPLTFAFNGGPGSASVWLHMGALGPKRVVLQPNGFMPAAPYRIEDNPATLLDRSDLVMVDAMGTGFSRAANAELLKNISRCTGRCAGVRRVYPSVHLAL